MKIMKISLHFFFLNATHVHGYKTSDQPKSHCQDYWCKAKFFEVAKLASLKVIQNILINGI